ncbi:MAG: DUF4214 domain-containing protein, partial [Lachnospiraceae bacterium]|nr:DUF4214 domain-containing protein [Lachnospiraceae bacterium]
VQERQYCDEEYTSTKIGLDSGTYYAYVTYRAVSNTSYVPYTLSINYSKEDAWEKEPNGNESNATSIPVNTEITGNCHYSNDKDGYTFTATTPGKISVSYYNDPLIKNYDDCKIQIYLYYWKETAGYYGDTITEQKELFKNDYDLTTVLKTTEEYEIPEGKYYLFITFDGYREYKINDYKSMANYHFKVNFTGETDNKNESTLNIKKFVTRLYDVALDRTPEESGLKDWTNRLQTGEAAAVNVVQGVLCSDEYKNKGKSNGEIVNDCYQAMLGRAADESGYNDWVTKLDSGMSVNAIFAGFVGSEEFGNLCSSYGINPGTYELTEARDMNAGTTQFVSRLYTQALGRSFDADGLNDWCGQINTNPSRDNILNISTNGFLNSQEFQNKGLDNTEYVKVLYRTYLGREYDDAGLSDWVGQLDRGEKDRNAVAAGFAYSAEFSNIMAQYGL